MPTSATPPVDPESVEPKTPAQKVTRGRKPAAEPAEAAATTTATEAATEPLAASTQKRRFPVKLAIAVGAPLLAVATIASLVALNQQAIADQWAVWNYEPSPAIDSYVEGTTMTAHAMWLFEASKPRVAPDSEFNDICSDEESGTGVLGCYTPDDKHITLFEVADERLAGLRQAVATHEMLHAAWDRMGEGEREHLATLFDAELKRLAEDDDFQDQLDAYDFENDDDRYNELHSIVATEVTGISDELETYYERYFGDREALVGLYAEAHEVLVEIAAKVEALNDELDALEKEIDADYESYEAGWDKLDKDWDAFTARNKAYFYKSQSAFDRDQNALFARSDALDQLYDDIQVKVDQYTELLDQLTELDAEAADLFDSINIDVRSKNA